MICTEVLTEHNVMYLECMHRACKVCLPKWVAQCERDGKPPECPVCKHEMSAEMLEEMRAIGSSSSDEILFVCRKCGGRKRARGSRCGKPCEGGEM